MLKMRKNDLNDPKYHSFTDFPFAVDVLEYDSYDTRK